MNTTNTLPHYRQLNVTLLCLQVTTRIQLEVDNFNIALQILLVFNNMGIVPGTVRGTSYLGTFILNLAL